MSTSELIELLGSDETSDEAPAAPRRGVEKKRAHTLEESVLIGRLLFFCGRVGEADRLLRPLVRIHQDRADLLKLWAQIKHTQGQLTEAVRTFERLHAKQSQPSELMHLEMIHRMSQHPEAAKR